MTTLVVGLATSGLAVVDALLADGEVVRAIDARAEIGRAHV